MIKIYNKSLWPVLKKGTSVWVCAAFLLTSVSMPQVRAEPPLTSVTDHRSLSDDLTASIALPNGIGTIQEIYRGTSGKIVVLIQDAHSIPDAQRSIRSVIDHFQTQYGISLVGLEGASEKLDSQIFKSFPDKELLRKTFDAYAQRGELTGGSAAALFNAQPCLYYGLEDWSLYEEGISYFLKAVGMEPEIKAMLDPMVAALNREKEAAYSKELLEVDRALANFGENKADLLQILSRLSKYQPPPQGSELAVLLEEVQREQITDAPIEIEVKKITEQALAFLKSQTLTSEIRQDLQELTGMLQAFRTAKMTPQAFALYLKSLIQKHKMKVKVSRKLAHLVENQKQLKDIEGTRLFEEFKRYADSVKGSLFQNDPQKTLDMQTRGIELLRRLGRLELSFEDWRDAQKMVALLDRWAVPQEGVIGRNEVSRLLGKMEPHFEFYRIAEKRDQVFLRNVQAAMEQRKKTNSLIVAGGFHTEGLTRAFEAKGISYVLVMPWIGSMPEEPFYREHMQGQVSWRNYFEIKDGKINLYDAFVRATRDKLLGYRVEDRGDRTAGADPNPAPYPPPSPKEWRDQIIRDLAANGRITQAAEYTRFIDELSQTPNLKEKWLSNIDRFGEGLKKLQIDGTLSESSILQLIKSMKTAVPYDANQIVPRCELRLSVIPKADVEEKPGALRAEVRASDEDVGQGGTAFSVDPQRDRTTAEVIGFFSGWTDYAIFSDTNINRSGEENIYSVGTPEVQEIYHAAARALGFLDGAGSPDMDRFFLSTEELPQDAGYRNSVLGVRMLAYGLARYKQWLSGSKVRGFSVSFKALSAQGYGALVAAVASGSLSLEQGLKLAVEIPRLISASKAAKKCVVMRFVSKEAEPVLRAMTERFGDKIRLRSRFSNGSQEGLLVYVDQGAEMEVFNFFNQEFPDETNNVSTMAMPPDDFAIHSPAMSGVRMDVEKLMSEIMTFNDPAIPIVSDRGGALLTRGEDVRGMLLDMLTEPGDSRSVARAIDEMESNAFIQFGKGVEARKLSEENFMTTPKVDSMESGPEGLGVMPLLHRLRSVENLLTRLENVGSDFELTEKEHAILRSLFRSIQDYPLGQKILFNYLARMIKKEMMGFERPRPPAFYQCLTILQNTYLAQVVLKIAAISSDALVPALRFRKQLAIDPATREPPVDVELRILDRRGDEMHFTLNNYKHLEVVTFAFNQLNLSFPDLALRTRQMLESQPLARQIYEEVRRSMGLKDIGYFTGDQIQEGDDARYEVASLVYQYVMFRLLNLYRAALVGQNFLNVTGVGPVGQLAALAVSQALSIQDAVKLCQMRMRPPGDPAGDAAFENVLLADPKIRFYDPATGGLFSRKEQLQTLLRNLRGQPSAGEEAEPLSLPYQSRIISFDPDKRLKTAETVSPETVVFVEGLLDVWRRNVNPNLDMVEDLSILLLTDQNRKVYRFAEGIGVTTGIVYSYVGVDETVLNFFKGGSGSLTILIKPKKGPPFVRKILSGRFVPSFEGAGVMMDHAKKALEQTRYLQGLPAELAGYFPVVRNVVEREIPIPPGHPDFERQGGSYKELVYDMDFMPGADVSEFIREHQPPPEVVAKIYSLILKTLREKVHVHRKAPPSAPETLEESYFRKIEQRLVSAQRDLPQVFRPDLLEPETITINGVQYRNIRPLLAAFRQHPEFLRILEPRFHNLVMGDTNTENIRITNPQAILSAMARGDTDFTAESCGLKFLDPRSIGFRSKGATTVDDPAYDWKSPHNAWMGHYDELHNDLFSLSIEFPESGPKVDVTYAPASENPYAGPYEGLENYFKQIVTEAWDLDNPESEFLREDPYWVIRFVFLMGTHFAAMAPFHIGKELDGTVLDDYEHQKRPVALYSEGIKWLNLALDMLEGKRTELWGVRVPALPSRQGPELESQGSPQEARNEVRLQGPQDMSKEARLFFSPWSRLARGTGLGPHTIDYDPKAAAQIRSSFDVLGEKVPQNHAYNNFSKKLVDLILDLEAKGGQMDRSELESRTDSILESLHQESGTYQFATAAAILMDAYAKMGLDPSLLVNAKHDLVQETLDKIETIPLKNDGIYGFYERVTAYTSLFVSMGQLGMKDRLVSGDKNYIKIALDQLETIPSPWNRGRGSSMLFATLKVLGFERYLWEGGRDFVKETLDYIDQAEALNIWPTFPATQMSHDYFTIEPYITMLNAISILGRPEYLNYKEDRIAKVNQMMTRLSPEETALIGEYYLLTLYNLGALDRVVPDLDRYLQDFAHLMDTMKPAPYWFPNGVAYPYAMETLYFFGKDDLITEEMIDRMDNSLPDFVDAKDVTNWGHPLSYIFNIHAQLGSLDRIFEPSPRDNPAYGGQSVMEWGIRRFAGDPAGFQKSLPMFDHSLISAALRMRGRERNESPLYQPVTFLGDTEREHGPRAELRQFEQLPAYQNTQTPGSYAYENMTRFLATLKRSVPDPNVKSMIERIEGGETVQPAAYYVGSRQLNETEQRFAAVFDGLLRESYGKPWLGEGAPDINHIDLVDYGIFLASLVSGHFLTGVDPYEAANKQRIDQSAAFLTERNADVDIETLPETEAIRRLAVNVLFGNKHEGVIDFSEEFDLPVDGSSELAAAIQAVGPDGILDIFVDNSGPEFAAVLQMTTYLLERKIVGKVRIHIKPYPFSISDVWGRGEDVLEPHVNRAIRSLRASGEPVAVRTAERAQKFMGKELLIQRDDILAYSGDFGKDVAQIRNVIPNSSLAIFNGDFNNMKMFGDRLWPHTEDLAEVAKMLPGFQVPVAILRMAKTYLILGLPADSPTDNTVGVIQVFPATDQGARAEVRTSRLTPESRFFINGWNRFSRGMGIGMFPTDYDPEMADNLRTAIQELEARVPKRNTYNTFSNMLSLFTLDMVDPKKKLSAAEVKERVGQIIVALRNIRGPLLFVNAAALLFETLGKLGLDSRLVVNKKEQLDLVREALDKVEKIKPTENTASGARKAKYRGKYDQVISYAQLFMALGHLGLKDRLLDRPDGQNKNYVEKSLAVIDEVPSPFARGRYASQLFSALKAMGLDDHLFNNAEGRDYVKELLDYLDDKANWEKDPLVDRNDAYDRAYPYLLTFLCLSALGKPEYLSYKRDRLDEAKKMIGRLSYSYQPSKYTMYAFLAAANLGIAAETVAETYRSGGREEFLESILPPMEGGAINQGGLRRWFSEERNLGYAYELMWAFGWEDQIPESVFDRMKTILYDAASPNELRIEHDAYAGAQYLTVLGERGHGWAKKLFEPAPELGGISPYLNYLDRFTQDLVGVKQFLPMINHGILNYALRMRGTDRSALFQNEEAATAPPARKKRPARARAARAEIRSQMPTNEAKVFINQWNRISRGAGIGMYSTDFNPEMAKNLRGAVAFLEQGGSEENAYNHFSNLLTLFILDEVDPAVKLSQEQVAARTEELLAALRAIQGSLLYVNAGTLLIEAFGKLGLDPSLLINKAKDLDIIRDLLNRIPRISPDENTASGVVKAASRGNYDQLISYAQLFTAIGNLGLRERLLEDAGNGRNYVETALATIEDVPSPFARGRYASQLFSALKVLGYEKYIFENHENKDHLRNLLDYMDDENNRALDAKLTTSPEYQKAYPAMLILDCISVLGAKGYLSYKKDRVAEAGELLTGLKANDDVAKFVTFYLLALSNLGVLEERIPDPDKFIDGFSKEIFAKVDKNTGYAVELYALFGDLDRMPEGLIQQWIASLDISKEPEISRIPPYTAAFMLTILGQLGHDKASLLFEPGSASDGQSPFIKFLMDFSKHPGAVRGFLPMINHSLINYALRMRGAGREPQLFEKVLPAAALRHEQKSPASGETRNEARAKLTDHVRANPILVGMHIADIQDLTASEIVALGKTYQDNGIIPEIGANEEGIKAIQFYRAQNPDAVIAAGEIEEHNVERAVAAVRAGANILIALENPISAEVVAAVRAENPDVVIIASAKDEAEAERSIRAGVDGIKIRPFALDPQRIPENLALAKRLKEKYPELLIGGSRGISPDNVPMVLTGGLEFVGIGVNTAIEAAARLREATAARKTGRDAAPVSLNIRAYSNESRLIHSPWMRLARGIGLGQNPVPFNPQAAKNIGATLDLLDQKVPADHAYHRFSSKLTRMILSVTASDRPLSEPELQASMNEVLEALRSEKNPYEFVVGASIVLETIAKLGLSPSLVVNGSGDLIREAFDRIQTIPSKNDGVTGAYERASAYGTLFLAIGHIGMKERLAPKTSAAISEALATLDQIPTAWNRVRAASLLFLSLKLLGFENELFQGGRDRMEEMFDLLDASDETFGGMSKPFIKVFPLLTFLNFISALGDVDLIRYYLNYQKDRVREAADLMKDLSPMERALMAQYFLVGLANLSRLESTVEDPDGFLEALLESMDSIDTKGNWFPNGVAWPYVLQTLMLAGREGRISKDVIRRALLNLKENFKDPKFAVNRDNPLAYTLNVFDELERSADIFTPDPELGSVSPFNYLVEEMGSDPAMMEKGVPSLDHALINMALRMRGVDAGQKDELYQNIRFLPAQSTGTGAAPQPKVSPRTATALADALKPGEGGSLERAEAREVESCVVQGNLDNLLALARMMVGKRMAGGEGSVQPGATPGVVENVMDEAMVKRIVAAMEARGIKGNLTMVFADPSDVNLIKALQTMKDVIGTAVFPTENVRDLDRKALEGLTIQTVKKLEDYNPVLAENSNAVPVMAVNPGADIISKDAFFGVGLEPGNVQGGPFLEEMEYVARIVGGLFIAARKSSESAQEPSSEEINAELLKILFQLDIGAGNGPRVFSMDGKNLVIHREALQQIMVEYQAASAVRQAA